MSHYLKLLSLTALSVTLLMACSNEAVKVQPATPANDQLSATEDATEKAAMEKTAMVEKEVQKAKEQAMAKTEADAIEAKEAMMRAEEEAKVQADKNAKAAKEAMTRAEAQAKAAKEAMAQAEEQRRMVEQKQAALEAQRAKDAQILRDAEITRAAEAKEAEARKVADAAQAAAATQEVRQAQAITNPNAPYNAFLSKYVSSVNGINLVAYDKVTPQDRATLRAYIEKLSAMDIEALPRDAEMATWFNLYNAKTIELILENYPTKSIRKISNPWKKDRLVVNGKKMSLDDIEHGTVRKKYNEPRVHYAFNCASIGCPNVKATAWEAATLEADLAQAARDFIASERGVSIQGNKVIASSIFKWYKKDFGGNETSLLAHFRKYATGSKKAALDAATDINKYDYDWDLNIR